MNVDHYSEEFETLTFSNPADGVLQITMEGPGLNSVDPRKHRQLAEVWSAIDRDADVRVALLAGAGKGFSAGGSFELLDAMTEDYGTALEVLREARDLVNNVINCSKPIVSAMWGPAVGAGLVAGLLADVSVAGKTARIIDCHTRLGVAAGDHAAICWPLLCGLAKAKYYLLTADFIDGKTADQIGLVSKSLPGDELLAEAERVATKLATGPQRALQLTKRSLNLWMQQASPVFEASLAFEMLGFLGSESVEGVAAMKERRKPDFG